MLRFGSTRTSFSEYYTRYSAPAKGNPLRNHITERYVRVSWVICYLYQLANVTSAQKCQ
ncbi:hypothetical protein RRG08_062664, partial [Elysia crispata]